MMFSSFCKFSNKKKNDYNTIFKLSDLNHPFRSGFIVIITFTVWWVSKMQFGYIYTTKYYIEWMVLEANILVSKFKLKVVMKGKNERKLRRTTPILKNKYCLRLNFI